MKKKLRIGLVGFGTIGYCLYQIISNEDLPFEIVKICVKQKGKLRPISSENFVFDSSLIINDKSIDIVVELINESEAALDIVTQSLINGIPVISASKKMIAGYLLELSELQKKYKSPFLYEGAVCGSIPIINLLNRYYRNDNLDFLYSICNGTTNYILTKIKDGLAFKQALKEAQDKGFAEADSSSDIFGFDSRYKLTILLAHAYGLIVDYSDIFCLGIQNIIPEDYEFARKEGYDIKLIAHAIRNTADKEIYAYVMPTLVKVGTKFSLIENEYNAINIKGIYIGEHFISGIGAGGQPTSIAVLSDMMSIYMEQQTNYPYPDNAENYCYSKKCTTRICIRYKEDSLLNQFKFDKVIEEFSFAKVKYIIAETNLSSLNESLIGDLSGFFIMCYLKQE